MRMWGFDFVFLISSFSLHNPLSSRPDSNTIFPRGTFPDFSNQKQSCLFWASRAPAPPSDLLKCPPLVVCVSIQTGSRHHLGRTAGPHTAPPLVRRGCTKMFLQAQPTLPWMCGGGEGTTHRFKWAACLGDRDHTKLKADSHKPRGPCPAHFTLRLAQKVHPHPHPPSKKNSPAKTRQGDGSLPSHYPGVAQSSWADV